MTPYERQAEFLGLEVREAMYGGAGFGGKSFALMMAAGQFVQDPEYSGLLIRRTHGELIAKDGLLDVANRWWKNTAAWWSEKEKTWHFPSGARLQFGYLEADSDLGRYDGPSYHYVGLDELTGYTEHQYRFFFRRIRRSKHCRIPLRIRSGTNPGGRGHEWVKARFIDGGEPRAVTVRAFLEDNIYGDRQGYIESLSYLHPTMRAQMQHGDWSVREAGRYFRRTWVTKFHDERPADLAILARCWDLAATAPDEGKDPDWTSGGLWGLRETGNIVGCGMARGRWTAGSVEAEIRARALEDGPGVPIIIEQEGGASSKILIAGIRARLRMLGPFEVYESPPSKFGSKIVRAQPLSAAWERGEVEFVRGPYLGPLFDEFEAFPDPNDKKKDDQVDTGSMASFWLPYLLQNRKGNRTGSGPARQRRSYLD